MRRSLLTILVALSVLAEPLAGMQPAAVTWGNLVLIDQTGTTIAKTPGANELYDSGALSVESITTTGVFTFTLVQVGGFRVGLSTDVATDNIMSHYWQFPSTTGVDGGQVREAVNGWVHSETSALNDTWGITVGASGLVTYQHNGTTVYTSLTAVSLPTKLDFGAQVSNSSIKDATIDTGGGGGGPTFTPRSLLMGCCIGI